MVFKRCHIDFLMEILCRLLWKTALKGQCLLIHKYHLLRAKGFLDAGKKWAKRDLMKLYKTKCKVLHLGWNNPLQENRPNLFGSSFEGKAAGTPRGQ